MSIDFNKIWRAASLRNVLQIILIFVYLALKLNCTTLWCCMPDFIKIS